MKSSIIHLATERLSVVIDPSGGVPEVLHWGEPVKLSSDEALRTARTMPVLHGGLDVVSRLSLLPEHGSGYQDRPGVEGFRLDGSAWSPRFAFVKFESGHDIDRSWVTVFSVDVHAGLAVESDFEVHTSSDVLRTRVTLRNTGDTAYTLAALRQTLPLASDATEVLTFAGRWAKEFIEVREPLSTGSVTVENRSGRTSHGRVPVAFVGTRGFCADQGVVRAVHLEWSGNSFVSVDVSIDGRRSMQAGELLLAGEVILAPGQSYSSPWASWAHSSSGTNEISRRFHAELRRRPNHPTTARPVTLNIWEAVYFDHNLDRLRALAEAAASIGVERFVIDDGWFHLRRNDRAGLGDWWVDPDVWPDGLTPIAEKVVSLGMQLGLWFEPEMVNPDSDLYRTHPDWVLTDPGYEPVMGRHQLVLDLGRSEVRDYLFKQISDVLSAYPISYVKWDHNRELVQAAHEGKRAGVHQQTLGVYELFDRLRTAHPTVEIESCSSGGGRIDFKILDWCSRFWVSDCIDPHERQLIQRGFSHVFPAEYMGSHIASEHSHTTRRKHSLAFRAATALFGHLGIEWNVLDAGPEDRTLLAAVIATHKEHRELLHTGLARRFDHPNPAIVAHGVIAPDASEALVSFATISASASLLIEPFRISGLDPARLYAVNVVNLAGGTTGAARVQPSWLRDGATMSGSELAVMGLQPPALDPEQALILRLVAL